MFKKLTGLLEAYFGISKKEARGALVLMVLCLLLLWMPFVFRRWILPVMPISRQPVDIKMLDSIAVLLEKEQQSKFKEYKPYPKRDFTKKRPKTIRLFDFDPNSTSVTDLETLGIPLFLARRIDKFRSKGGKFRKKQDLLNIYDFPSELFHKLENHIVIKSASSILSGSLDSRSGLKSNTSSSSRSDSRSVRGARPGVETPGNGVFEGRRFGGSVLAFDVNLADTVQLVRLRGIGSKISVRILKFRDALGGFHSENQYAEIFGLDSVALSELRRYAKVTSAVKKININAVSAEELGRHPYLRNKMINATIINYRSQHGPFSNIDDLKKVKVMDEALIKKIGPYLSF
jgi:competence ComEA-like helix-hairpin-helix protein